MATYMIFLREGEIVDQEAMAAYRSGVSGTAPATMKPLTVYGAMETFEGEPADGVVILEFPDTQAARDWYFSDSYQERAKLRQKAAPYRCFMVEGV
ncbi:MAG: DUF1330 domain-containing protein [Novosphingobium sp.]|nr:DUF1330 domain-containing protein [Novosphingobium sp.]